MKKVRVYYSGWGEHWPLGLLADNGKQILFEYDAEALKQGLELSPLNLKLKLGAYSDFPSYLMRLPGLIADCLPDGWGLLLMDKLFRKRGMDLNHISPLDRLSFLGDQSMGALTFEPLIEEEIDLQNFKLSQLAKEVQKIICEKATTLLPQLAHLGGSPQGARPKILLNYHPASKTVSTEPKSKGTPWLIKFQAKGEHKEVPALEALYAHLAKKAGLQVANTEYFDLGKNLSAFGTERFDRDQKGRIPIHSLAGALHADFRLPSSVSYNSYLRLTRLMTGDEREVYQGFRQCVFNIVFNNRDDHSKNFSFRLDQKRNWKLAPAYDLTFSTGPGGEHHMDISGEGRSPGRAHLFKLAEESGLKKERCDKIIESITEVALQFKVEAKNWPIRSATVAAVHRAITTNLKNMQV